MNTIELKNNFHELIDNFEDESVLSSFFELMQNANSKENGRLWNRLSIAEQEELLIALEESEFDNNLIDNDEVMSKYKEWLVK